MAQPRLTIPSNQLQFKKKEAKTVNLQHARFTSDWILKTEKF